VSRKITRASLVAQFTSYAARPDLAKEAEATIDFILSVCEGDEAHLVRDLARTDWLDITIEDIQRMFGETWTGVVHPQEDCERLRDLIAHGRIKVSAVRVPNLPENEARESPWWRSFRGQDEHHLRCYDALVWLLLATEQERPKVRIEGEYADGRYDVGVPSLRLAIECGYVSPVKVVHGCEAGWNVVIATYDCENGYRFDSTPDLVAEAEAERWRSAKLIAERIWKKP